MAFLNRLFNRKSKTELVASSPQPGFRRSLTDPNPPSSFRARSSSSDDKDTFELMPPTRLVTARQRRVGCEISRAKTSIEVGSVRTSNSSVAEPASTSADGIGKNQYRTLKALHRSRLHTIHAAQDRSSKRTVVMKAFHKHRMSSTLRAKLDSEITHLRALTGVPGVVQYINHFEDDECAYIVLERCPGTTLIELIANCGGRLSEQTLVADVLIPLVLLLSDLHRRGIVHRQLKPEHVLCATETATVTVVDFAEAVNTKQRCLNNRAGALEYMAPEVLDKPTAEEVFHQVLYNGMSEEELPQYDEKADVWSLGALAYEALTGCQPFLADGAAEMSTVQRELLTELDPNGTPLLLSGKPLSPEARSFLLSVLQLDPINRPSAEKLLQHPLLQRYWPRYQAKQVALLASATSSGSGSGEVAPPASPMHSVGLAAAAGEAVTVAVAAAARAAGAAAAGAAAGCASPGTAGGGKANFLLAAPLQFPVR